MLMNAEGRIFSNSEISHVFFFYFNGCCYTLGQETNFCPKSQLGLKWPHWPLLASNDISNLKWPQWSQIGIVEFSDKNWCFAPVCVSLALLQHRKLILPVFRDFGSAFMPTNTSSGLESKSFSEASCFKLKLLSKLSLWFLC